jgi:hypothetical protein
LRLDGGNLVFLVCTATRVDIPFVVCTKELAFQGQDNTTLSVNYVHFATAIIHSKYPAKAVSDQYVLPKTISASDMT